MVTSVVARIVLTNVAHAVTKGIMQDLLLVDRHIILVISVHHRIMLDHRHAMLDHRRADPKVVARNVIVPIALTNVVTQAIALARRRT